MTGHGDLQYFHGGASVAIQGRDHPEAHYSYVCPHCNERTNGAVLAKPTPSPQNTEPPTLWLRCTGCHRGAVLNGTDLAPATPAGPAVEGLPQSVADAYLEARRSAGVGAFTASELMCRKILMNVAVDKGSQPNNSFAQYLEYLSAQGYITPPMKPWVDHIRLRGNEATHEIPAPDRDQALGTLEFTANLLQLMYEMDHRIRRYVSTPSGAPSQP